MHSVKPLTPREEEWIEEPSAELRKVIDEGLESIRQGEGRKYTLEELRVMMGL